jgi:hypothetical protein
MNKKVLQEKRLERAANRWTAHDHVVQEEDAKVPTP